MTRANNSFWTILLRTSARVLRVLSLSLACIGGLVSCAHSAELSAAAVPIETPTLLLSRYISNDAATVLYVDLGRVNSSFYRPYIRRLVKFIWGVDLEETLFVKTCQELYVTAHPPLGKDGPEYGMFVAHGCREQGKERFPYDTEVRPVLEGSEGNEADADKTPPLRLRLKKLGMESYAMKISPIETANLELNPVSDPLRFNVGDKVLAIRLSHLQLQRFASSEGLPDALIRELAQMVEIRFFVGVDPTLAVWADFEFVAEAPAEAFASWLPAWFDGIEKGIVVRELALDRAIRRLQVERSNRRVRVSLSMQKQDAEIWVQAVNRGASEWVMHGGAEGIASSIGQRLVPAPSGTAPGISRVRPNKRSGRGPAPPRRR